MVINSTLPPALVVPASGSWFGNDGSWSAFTISVGTPPQNFSVLPATNGADTWVPIADDCKALNVSNCGSLRGVLPFSNAPSPGFQSNLSTSWELIGLYQLGQDTFLGFTGNGASGYDSVALIGNNAIPTLQMNHQVVTAYATPEFWLGQIGLGKRGMNFRQDERPESFLTNLKDSGHIPSLSFGYTAGAPYRSTKVPASLTLGGYDQARTGEVLKVPVNGDDDRPLTVGVQDIVVTNSLNGTISLSDTAILAPIDSSVPDLWLPQSICDKFADAFGLQYNAQTNRYILSSSTRTRLEQLSPVLTFTVGTQLVEGMTINLQLPYSAFDLQASYPIFADTVNYFPIRRAANDSQYMIGRAFLQEVYLSVDFERSYFNVSQAAFGDPMPDAQIITIPPANGTTNLNGTTGTPAPHSSNGGQLAGGAIAGIVIGALIGSALVLGIAWVFCIRPARRSKVGAKKNATADHTTIEHPKDPEIMGEEIGELHAHHGQSEVQQGWPVIVEAEGSPPPVYEMKA